MQNRDTDLGKLNIKHIISKFFFMLFCFFFTIIMGGVVYANERYGLIAPIIFLFILFFIIVFYFLNTIFEKNSSFLIKNYSLILICSLGFLFALNIANALLLRYEPIFDLGAIFTGAAEWAKTGAFTNNLNWSIDPNYFYYFPNNLGGMTLLYVAFRIATLLGLTDYFMVAALVNGLLAVLTVLLSVLICKKLFGVQKSILVLMFFILSPPFYFIAPVFYTDSLSLIFPVLSLFIYLKYLAAEKKRKKVFLAFLLGIIISVGIMVKFTVIITLIAIVIYDICSRGIKSALLLSISNGITIALLLAGFNAYFYSNHIDQETAKRLNTPYLHWVMMSLEGSGGYNPGDYEFTRSFENPAERDAAIKGKIKERVEGLGIKGLSNLFYIKEIACFGDGTYAQSDFLDDNPVYATFMHELVLYDGTNYEPFKYVSSGVFFAIQALMLAGAYGYLLRKKSGEICFAPQLCVFGIMLFFMCWEVSGRYVTNFVPLLMISAVPGVEFISEWFHPGV